MANQSLKIIDKVCKSVAPRYRHVSPVDALHWSTEKQHVMTVINRSKDLRQATEQSLHDAVLQSASMGLSLNPSQHHCYLIPRRARKRKQGESEKSYLDNVPIIAYASPSYRGLSHLATSSGAVSFIRAEIVFKDDVFDYFGPHEKPKYIGNSIKSARRSEPDAIGVFAIAKTQQGDFLTEFIDRATVQKIRKMSEMPNGTMWNPEKLWSEGWKKAAVRRLYKTLPDSSPMLDYAIDHLNEYEGLSQQEKEVEAVQVLSEDQALNINTLLDDHKIIGEQKTKWLVRIATRFGVADYKQIPAADYNEAYKIIETALKAK